MKKAILLFGLLMLIGILVMSGCKTAEVAEEETPVDDTTDAEETAEEVVEEAEETESEETEEEAVDDADDSTEDANLEEEDSVPENLA